MMASVAFSAHAQNNALHFDGVNDKVTTSLVLSTTTYPTVTMECRFKPEQLNFAGDYQGILGNDAGGYNSRQIWIKQNANTLSIAVAGTEWEIADTLLPNAWNHVAVVYTPTEVKAYVNGVLHTNNTADNNTSQAGLAIGVGFMQTQPFKGVIDEVRIWSAERTAQDLMNMMNQELTGSESDLLAYYNFNQGNANGANDTITLLLDSKNTYHGTLVNFALTGSESNFVEQNYVSLTDPQTAKITVYPNPASDFIMVSGVLGTETISIWNMQGKLMYQSVLSTQPIPVKHLPKGTYIIHVAGSQGRTSQTWIKQ